MKISISEPKKSINKAFLKEKIGRAEINRFKKNFFAVFDNINNKADEENLKSIIVKFLDATWYADRFQVNPLGKNDLTIHTGKLASNPVGVLIEFKSIANKTEMFGKHKPNVKAFHELVLYYLTARITKNEHEIKNLIITNIIEWYIFDANEFDNLIYKDSAIRRLFEQKRREGKDNPWFYEEVKRILATREIALEATFFNILDFKKFAENNNREDERHLIPLYKVFSPEHLLKLSFANDSNSLKPKFYSELLHIIGLHEFKESNKKLIGRQPEMERNTGSLLENVIVNLESHDKISRLPNPGHYGSTYEDRLYNVALELVITWINRILFLKLLEAQLLNYHKGNKDYNFLNKDKLKSFDGLDNLFFRVLARRHQERDPEIKKVFGKVPYLNSSLFEPTELEQITLFINGLENFTPLSILGNTVLTDHLGVTRKGQLNTLDYLFEFLNAYDFSSEGSEEIQEENKPLINASVLGLIFEKINGYKDGSFFTPGYITMYMSRQTIRRAIVQKFNERYGWQLEHYNQLYDKITDRKEANKIINSLKICDPAVGSGHFLVSALNEIIAIKSDLNILTGTDGRTLKDYIIEVANDELVITDENGDAHRYNPGGHRSQILQQTLFREKQIIIENCLFGVDINPNSVKICRLRLWIELLKNSYYKTNSMGELELETLPNIDINIKSGNSLISRYSLDSDLKNVVGKSNLTMNQYYEAVHKYHNSDNKELKKEIEQVINVFKFNFKEEIGKNSLSRKELERLESEYHQKYVANQIFEGKLSEAQTKHKNRLNAEISALKSKIEAISTGKKYQNAFEWRFEFPAVLNNEGDFTGFDIIIGNPPYGVKLSADDQAALLEAHKFGTAETAILFIKYGFQLLNNSGIQSFIIPKSFIYSSNYEKIRLFALPYITDIIDCGMVWPDVKLEVCIFVLNKQSVETQYHNLKRIGSDILPIAIFKKDLVEKFGFYLNDISAYELEVAESIRQTCFTLNDISTNKRGEGLQRLLQPHGELPVIGGIDISRTGIRGFSGYLKRADISNTNVHLGKNLVWVQNIVAHILNPKPHIKITACLPPEPECLILDTINRITIANDDYSPELVWCILNSRLINWYVYIFIYGRAIRTMHFDNFITSRLPIPKSINPDLNSALVNLVKDHYSAGTLHDINLDLLDEFVYKIYNLSEYDIEKINSYFE